MICLLWQKPSFEGQKQIFSDLLTRQKQFHYLRSIRGIFALHDVHDLKALAVSVLALFCAKDGELIGNEVVVFGQVAASRAMLVLCVRKVGAARSKFYAKVWEGYGTMCACHGQRGVGRSYTNGRFRENYMGQKACFGTSGRRVYGTSILVKDPVWAQRNTKVQAKVGFLQNQMHIRLYCSSPPEKPRNKNYEKPALDVHSALACANQSPSASLPIHNDARVVTTARTCFDMGRNPV